MKQNDRMTSPGHFQDVRHLILDVPGLHYSPGDAIALCPRQSEDSIDTFLKRFNLDGESVISIEEENITSEGPSLNGIKKAKLRDVIASSLDVSSAPPRRYFFEVISHFATLEMERGCLRDFASSEGKDDLYRYCQRERRTVLEVMDDFKSVINVPLEWLLQVVPRLRPRLFSVASSSKEHKNEAHVAAAPAQWKTHYGRQRQGLCTAWLRESVKPGDVLSVWIEKGSIALPLDETAPLVMVGPGTGIAPFRSDCYYLYFNNE